jgi:ribonuclease HI
MNLGIANALYVEIMGVILAIEFAFEKQWNFMLIESDSKLVTLTLESPSINCPLGDQEYMAQLTL